jgi:hypothetical protein
MKKKKGLPARSKLPMSGDARREQLLKFLQSNDPAWLDENHPELKNGAAAWVRKLRAESDAASRKRRGDWAGVEN